MQLLECQHILVVNTNTKLALPQSPSGATQLLPCVPRRTLKKLLLASSAQKANGDFMGCFKLVDVLTSSHVLLTTAILYIYFEDVD